MGSPYHTRFEQSKTILGSRWTSDKYDIPVLHYPCLLTSLKRVYGTNKTPHPGEVPRPLLGDGRRQSLAPEKPYCVQAKIHSTCTVDLLDKAMLIRSPRSLDVRLGTLSLQKFYSLERHEPTTRFSGEVGDATNS